MLIKILDEGYEWFPNQREDSIDRLKKSIDKALKQINIEQTEYATWINTLEDAFLETAPPILVDNVESFSNEQDSETTSTPQEERVHCPKDFPEKAHCSVEEINITEPTPFQKR